jgi:cobalt-zinc-cadmium efflux system outer membrane protein
VPPLFAFSGPTFGQGRIGTDQAVQPISIEAVIASAESANIDVLTARLAIKSAQASLRSADTAPNPVFSVNSLQVRPSRVGNLPYGQLVDTIVRVDMPLERGGKRRARTGSARASVSAAEDDLIDVQRQMRESVVGAYFDLKAAENRLLLLRSIADNYGKSQDIARKQQKAGSISNGDLARQQVESLRAAAEADQAGTDRREAQLALAVLIGREAEAITLATSSDWPVPNNANPEPADILAERRPDVRAAQTRVVAARRDLDGAHALRYPDVTVGVQYEKADGDVGVGDSVGLGVSVPIPVRNRYRGEVDSASVALTQAEAQATKIQAVAMAEIIVARRAAADAMARRIAFDDGQLPAARKAASVAEFAYARGALALLDLLDARRSLQAVELGAIDAHADEARAIARLRSAETTGEN